MLVMKTCKWDDREMTWEGIPSVSCTHLGRTIIEELEDGAGNMMSKQIHERSMGGGQLNPDQRLGKIKVQNSGVIYHVHLLGRPSLMTLPYFFYLRPLCGKQRHRQRTKAERRGMSQGGQVVLGSIGWGHCLVNTGQEAKDGLVILGTSDQRQHDLGVLALVLLQFFATCSTQGKAVVTWDEGRGGEEEGRKA